MAAESIEQSYALRAGALRDEGESMSFSILYVCTGNICRSPLAERLLTMRLDAALGQRSSVFGVTSAGTHGWDGSEMDPTAASQLIRLGGDPAGFTGRQLTPAFVQSADLVLTATRAHRQLVLSELPQALRRTFTMTEFAHLVESAHTGDTPVPADSPAELVAWAASRRGSATLDDYDVADPYGASTRLHHDVADRISACVDQTVAALAGTALSVSR